MLEKKREKQLLSKNPGSRAGEMTLQLRALAALGRALGHLKTFMDNMGTCMQAHMHKHVYINLKIIFKM